MKMKRQKILIVAMAPVAFYGYSGAASAGTCSSPCTIEGTVPEIRLKDTDAGQQSWEIEAVNGNFVIDQLGQVSAAFKIEPQAGGNQLVLDGTKNVGINTASPQGSNELEVAGNGGTSDTFASIAVSPGGPSDDSGRITVNDYSDTFSIGVRTGSGGYNTPLVIDLDAGNSELVITQQGRIGMGGKTIQQVNSAAQLHVAGDGNISGNVFLDSTGSAGDWLIDPGSVGLWLRNGAATSSPAPVKFQNGAPENSLVLDPGGKLGIGTDIPANPLHVERSDGTAQVKVKELASGNALRTLFNLICIECTPAFRFQQASLVWFFRMLQNGNFAVDFNGGSGNEFVFGQNGDLTVKGVVNTGSSRSIKEGIEEVDAREVLEKVAALPVSEWSYRADGGKVRHVGPMAEDFRAVFGLGESEKTISAVDTGGIALAAIKGLNEVLLEREAEIASQKAELKALRREIDELKAGQQRMANLEEMLRTLVANGEVAQR